MLLVAKTRHACAAWLFVMHAHQPLLQQEWELNSHLAAPPRHTCYRSLMHAKCQRVVAVATGQHCGQEHRTPQWTLL